MNVRQKLLLNAKEDRSTLGARVLECRQTTENLCQNLEPEDLTVQPISDVSPIKWHLAHTTWFFEELILVPNLKCYVRFNEAYRELFNSYYKSLGRHWAQGDRGSLSRPAAREIFKYRNHVNAHLAELFQSSHLSDEVLHLLELGIQHEQQHQELILMDIKYILSRNPLEAIFQQKGLPKPPSPRQDWAHFPEQIAEIGIHQKAATFSFDNERPQHKTYIYPFHMAESLVTNGEYLAFINAGGYEKPEYWLSLGWDWVNQHKIRHPLYWAETNGQWEEYTLHGIISLEPNYPVVHLSYFEADAFARWSGGRLPREAELELYLQHAEGLKDSPDYFHPIDANKAFHQVWCWTQSAYASYPGYQEFSGAVREYNGKFMCNQFVLRGGCVATPKGHLRVSYRNFFLPHQQWMFSGIRLAKDSL